MVTANIAMGLYIVFILGIWVFLWKTGLKEAFLGLFKKKK